MISLTPLPLRPTPHRSLDIRPRFNQSSLSDDKASDTVGNRTISAWRVAVDACWIQLRCPELARRVSKLDGAREVAKCHAGPYLRTFEVPHDFAWARSYVEKTITESN